MKIKQTNDKGEEVEVEVSTQEEVDAKIAAERAALEAKYAEELKSKETSAATLAQEKKDLEDKLEKMARDGMKEDHPNFKVLKEALNKKDDDIKAIKNELDSDRAQRVKDEMESAIKIAAKGNTELEKKIQYHLDKTLVGLKDSTKEERKVKLDAAVKLASDFSSEGQGMFDSGIGGGGRGNGGGAEIGNGPEFSAKEKALGAKLGITDADYKKYGSRVSKRS